MERRDKVREELESYLNIKKSGIREAIDILESIEQEIKQRWKKYEKAVQSKHETR